MSTTLEDIAKSFQTLKSYEGQINTLKATNANLFNSNRRLTKENESLRDKLIRQDRGPIADANDEKALFDGQVELKFTLPFDGGRKLVARRRGRTICSVRVDTETHGVLRTVLAKVHADLAGRR